MIQKYKILNAISEGIQTGFKITNKQDNSSIIDFSDSKINELESLNIAKIANKLIQEENFEGLSEYLNGVDPIIIQYFKIYHPSSKDALKMLIEVLVANLGPKIDLNWIDVFNLNDLSNLFDWTADSISSFGQINEPLYKHISLFNGNISKWNVLNVTDMAEMFNNSQFNGDISNWDVSNVTSMYGMFSNSSFNNDISNWNVSNVTDMRFMFRNSVFNQDISNWNVSNVDKFSYMFCESQFNQDISRWDVSNCSEMKYMFSDSKFNQNISNWIINYQCEISSVFKNCNIKNEFRPVKHIGNKIYVLQ